MRHGVSSTAYPSEERAMEQHSIPTIATFGSQERDLLPRGGRQAQWARGARGRGRGSACGGLARLIGSRGLAERPFFLEHAMSEPISFDFVEYVRKRKLGGPEGAPGEE